MTLDEVIYPDSLPKLDLHGYDRDSARIAIVDFVNKNYKMNRPIFCIIHGIGSGILYHTTQETLKTEKRVIEFKTHYNNNGCTLVRIKID